MATESYVQVAPDSTGKLVDAVIVNSATGQFQYRQSVVIGDASQGAGLAAVGTPATIGTALGVQIAADQLPIPVVASSPVLIGNDLTTPVPVQAVNLPQNTGQQPSINSMPVVVAPDQTPIPVVAQLLTNLPGSQPVSAPDGGIATIGTMQDQAQYGNVAGSVIAQLRGINDALVALNLLNQQQITLLGAILLQLNNLGVQLGAFPTPPPPTLQ